MVATAVLVLGQALISYEIFTGRILPKISLRREWRKSILGFSVFSFVYLTLATFGFSKIELFLTASYTFCISRTFLLKKSKDLRLAKSTVLSSIVASDQTSKEGRANSNSLEEKFQKSFDIFCSEILETSSALFINESKIPFITDLILRYPVDSPNSNKLNPNTFKKTNLFFEKENIAYLEEENDSDFALCLKVENDRSGDGLLFLGQKINGGLYSEEEIETARTVVSWMLSSLISESNSLILGSLQKKHIEDQRISDYKTRRMLHDEILPEIHSSILILSRVQNESAFLEQIRLLTDLHKRISSFLRELPDTSLEIQRLGLIDALIRRTDSEFETSWFDWSYDPGLQERFPISKPETLEVLFYACRESIRNAVKYSEEGERKRISVSFFEKNTDKKGILIQIKNRIERRRNSSVQSAGQGLKIHSALLKVFGGHLTLEFLNTNEVLVEIFLPEK